MPQTRCFAVAVALLALPAFAQEEVEHDDATARAAALREWRGPRDAAAGLRILEEARRERDRWSVSAGRGFFDAPVAAPATLFTNIGPERSDFSRNGTAQYQDIDSGRIRQIVPHPTNPAIAYISTSGGGVWKTYDGGAGWEPITDGLGTLAIGALAMDPSNPDILHLGFGDFADVQLPGMVRSTDGGITWTAPIPPLTTNDYVVNGSVVPFTAVQVRDIKVDPGDSRNVFAATNAGLFRSNDSGNSFQHVMLSSPTRTTAIYIDMWSIAWAGAHTWVVTGRGEETRTTLPPAGSGVWRSTQDGADGSWVWVADALPAVSMGRSTLAAAISTTDNPQTSRLFLLASTEPASAASRYAQLDLFRSDDGGRTWTALGVNARKLPTNPTDFVNNLNVLSDQSWYNQALVVDPKDPNTVFIGGQFGMVRSQDGGQVWSVLSDWLPAGTGAGRPYVHADFHAFAAGIDGSFWAGTDGGVFQSPGACATADCGARTGSTANVTFTNVNTGITTHLIYHLACAQPAWASSGASWVAAGLQDNGTRVRSVAAGKSTTFDQVLGGDGIAVAVSATSITRSATGTAGPAVMLASLPGRIRLSTDGGDTFSEFTPPDSPPFLVRIARETASSDPASFLTFSESPAGVWHTVSGSWTNASGTLHWPGPPPTTTAGFTSPTGGVIGLRQVGTHPGKAGTWGAVSNRFTYVTADSGSNWDAGNQPAPAGTLATQTGGTFALSSVEFDPTDNSGSTYYVTAKSTFMTDGNGKNFELPTTFGHLHVTHDRGLTWAGVPNGLPFVPFNFVKFDPGNPDTIYVGTEIGLYRSTDHGVSFARFGAGLDPTRKLGLPLVEVTDMCFSPGNDHAIVATYGRGLWQIGTDTVAAVAGVRGRGDTNLDQRIDGRDLLDLADAFQADASSPRYLFQADLVGTTNLIDDADLSALVAKLGGTP